MRLTRAEKQEIVEELSQKGEASPVVGIVDLHGLPATQLQQIKKELRDTATIRVARRTLIERALDEVGGAAEELKDVEVIQPALLFSKENPFALFRTIKEKKQRAPAKEGAIAPNDIWLEEGDTGLPPGPAIGELQALGASTEVEDGTISITKESVAVEAGEEIAKDVADMLNQLGMKPLEIGLNVKAIIEGDTFYPAEQLDIDASAYEQDLAAAVQQAFNLAVNAGYVTEETVRPLLQQAARQVRNLALEAGIVNEETVEELLAIAQQHASALETHKTEKHTDDGGE